MFHPVSERILRIRLKSHIGFMSLIAVYAPTNVPGNEEQTEAFYQSLQSVVEQVPVRDMLLIMGISMLGLGMTCQPGEAPSEGLDQRSKMKMG